MKLARDFGIRALFGTIVLCFSVPTLCFLAAYGSDQALTALITLAASVVAFYFGARSQKPPEKG